jgi:tetratricopeptide (TPR) repeat protein
LSRFTGATAFDLLVEHGYLVADRPGRSRFVTASLWREALGLEPDGSEEVEPWLNVNAAPDFGIGDDVLHAAGIARRVGDRKMEAHCLAEGLTRADRSRRWSDVLRLLSYPDPVPEAWTDEEVLGRVAAMALLLAPRLDEEMLLAIAGDSVRTVDKALGTRLLERAAGSSDPEVKLRAFYTLLDGLVESGMESDYERCLAGLRRLEEEGTGPAAGILDLLVARHERYRGRMEEAWAAASSATRYLQGTGLYQEMLAEQLLAVLRFGEEPDEAIARLERALANVDDPELEAQMLHNFVLMLGRRGRTESALEWSERGIRKLRDRGLSPPRVIGLRLRRAWSWVDLDRIEPARREAEVLLQRSTIRHQPRHVVTLLLILGTCDLYADGTDALRFFLDAWNELVATKVLEGEECRRLMLDAILDLHPGRPERTSQFVHSHETEITEPLPGDSLEVRTTNARSHAILRQLRGDLDRAVTVLEGELPFARQLTVPTAVARYLHHLARVRLARGRAAGLSQDLLAARTLLEEELVILPAPGHDYLRAQALFSLSQVLAALGDKQRAWEVVTGAIDLAQQIQSRRLLEECLQFRALDLKS